MKKSYLLKVKRPRSKVVEVYSVKVDNVQALDVVLAAWTGNGYVVVSCTAQ